MPVYNGERFIRQALDSLLSQTLTDFELVISDNHSDDRTEHICREYAGRDARIRYIRQDRNIGLFPNVEFVVRAAVGRYFMLVGDDDVYEPNFLERLVKVLENDAQVGLAYSNFGYIAEDGTPLPGGTHVLQNSSASRFSTLLLYIVKRPCLPMIMGVFRTDILRRALPFVSFKRMTGDIDNVFMVRVLSLSRVQSVDQVLFRYRLKNRASSLPSDWPASPLMQRRYLFMHNASVSAKMCQAICESDLPLLHKVVLVVHTYIVLFGLCLVLPVATQCGQRIRAALKVGTAALSNESKNPR